MSSAALTGSRSQASVGFSSALSATFIIFQPATNRDRPAELENKYQPNEGLIFYLVIYQS